MKKSEFLGGALCLDFLNTLHDTGADDPEEELLSDAHFVIWAVHAGILSADEASGLQARTLHKHVQLKLPGKKPASLCDNARVLRESLRQMFQRALRDGQVAPQDVEKLNPLLARFPAAGRIERSKDCDWKLNWESQEGAAEKIFYAIVKSVAELVSTGRWRAMRECASDSCTWMFLDTTKNHSRRWCEMARCGNRDKVHRFRARSRHADTRKAVRK